MVSVCTVFYSCRHYSGTQLLYRDFRCFSGPAQMILSAFLVLFLFKISEYVSVLSRKNQELAMQVSLLNQENERILTELQQLTGKNKTEL